MQSEDGSVFLFSAEDITNNGQKQASLLENFYLITLRHITEGSITYIEEFT
jgi:hypothetical protein